MVPRDVTRIRGEFRASESLKEAVGGFYDDAHRPKDLRLYTAAKRIVPHTLYHEHVFDAQIAKAEARIRKPLAQRALRLMGSPPPMVGRSAEGRIQFTFNAHPAYTLQLVVDALEEEIRSWESSGNQNGIVLELGRLGLREDPNLLNAAKRELLTLLRDPNPSSALTVGAAQVSVKDKLPGYPIKANLYWPPEDK